MRLLPRRRAIVGAAIVAAGTAGCAPRAVCRGEYCGTLVIAAPGEPSALLPPVSDDELDRDIYDQVFLKLADLGPAGSTVGDTGFVPQLADRWEWRDSLSLVFHLDARARWQDGRPVTANDVAFTYRVYTDSVIDSPFRDALAPIAGVEVIDSSAVVFRFTRRSPEMFFSATGQMRILPAHLLARLAPSEWHDAPFGRAPIGDGPYRFGRWVAGQSLELDADSTFFLGRPHLRRVIWRFTSDLSVAVTQVIAGDADAIQVLATPANVERVSHAARLAAYPYRGSVYGLVSLNLRAPGDRHHPHPILADAMVRRALLLSADRAAIAANVFRTGVRVPAAPLSGLWSPLWFPDLAPAPYDALAASRLLDSAGWRRDRAGDIRSRNGRKLILHLAVPGTSGSRKLYAELLQSSWRAVGVNVQIDPMEPATLQARETAGMYDMALEAWSADPSPASDFAGAWRTGGASNYGGFSDARFDRALTLATTARSASESRRAWHDALSRWIAATPAIPLYALDNVAAVDRRFADVRFRPDYWAAYLRFWRVPADRLGPRDRARS